MRALTWFFCIGAAAFLLSGCNQAQPVASAPPPPPTPAAAKFADLPSGQACTKKIQRYQKVLSADLASGNVEQKVYDQIEKELAQAAADCTDGLGQQSLKLVHASEVRHGYHV
jgi:hypothetical protein